MMFVSSRFQKYFSRLRVPVLPTVGSLLYLLSLALPGLWVDGLPAYGLAVFGFGWVSVLDVAHHQVPWAFFAWCANIPGAFALSAAWNGKRGTRWIGVAGGAIGLALCTLIWLAVGRYPTGASVQLGAGFYVWVAAYFVLLLNFMQSKSDHPDSCLND